MFFGQTTTQKSTATFIYSSWKGKWLHPPRCFFHLHSFETVRIAACWCIVGGEWAGGGSYFSMMMVRRCGARKLKGAKCTSKGGENPPLFWPRLPVGWIHLSVEQAAWHFCLTSERSAFNYLKCQQALHLEKKPKNKTQRRAERLSG